MSERFTRVCVVGLGYVGLPIAAMLAARGVSVIGVDVRPEVIGKLNCGQAHFSEPDLDALVHQAVQQGRMRAVATPEPADAFIIAVQTPINGDHSPDTSYVETAARSIAPLLARGNLIVIEATCPVGTTERISQMLAAARPDLAFPHDRAKATDVHICYCPERILPGRVLTELVENSRVIGGMTPASAEMAAALYSVFCKAPCIGTTARVAELVKLAENAFRDVNIAFANELSIVSHELGIDVWEVIGLANRHPRVDILRPGPGVGGHCIAVDPWFIVASAPNSTRLIKVAREVNDSKIRWVLDQIRTMAESIERPTVACLGLAYKADVDSLQESTAVAIVDELARLKIGPLIVNDPNIAELPASMLQQPQISWAARVEDAVAAADLIVLLVDHREYLRLDSALLSGKKVLDTRDCWPFLRQAGVPR